MSGSSGMATGSAKGGLMGLMGFGAGLGGAAAAFIIGTIITIIYSIILFIVGALTAFIYNIIIGLGGGLDLDFKER